MLYEEGAFQLKDPVERWIPSFADMRIWRGGTPQAPVTAPATEPVRVWHFAHPHVRGLTYGFPLRAPRRRPLPRRRLRMGHPAWDGPGGERRRMGRPAAPLRAGVGVELRRVHRRARPAGRGDLRAVARRVLRHPHLRAARDDRPPPSTPARASCGPPRRPCTCGGAGGKATATPMGPRRTPPAGRTLGWRGARRHRRRLPPLHRDAAPSWRAGTGCACSGPGPSTT